MPNIAKDQNGIIIRSIHYGKHDRCKHCGTPLRLDQDHFGEVNLSEISGKNAGIFSRHAFLCENCYHAFYNKFCDFFGYPDMLA